MLTFTIAGRTVSKRQFIKHLNSGWVIGVNGARACKRPCPEIMYLQARLVMGNHYVCNAGHETCIKTKEVS